MAPGVLTPEEVGRNLKASDIVVKYTVLCAIATTVPQWWASSPSVTALQLKMLSELSELYGVEFSQERARPLIASVAGGGLSFMISQNPLSMALKSCIVAVPVVGFPLRFCTGAMTVGTYTYVMGHAFVRHYEAGGGYHNFEKRQVREEARNLLHLPLA